MTTEDATYLIAHEEGIKLDKYLDRETVGHVRTLVRASGAMADAKRTPAKKVRGESYEIRFPGEFRTTDPIVPGRKLVAARTMTKVYPLLYVLENSIREVISRVMQSKHGTSWWDTVMVRGRLADVKARAESRKRKEEALSWHQARGEHNIDYVDLGDLEAIISANQSDFFPNIISPDREWFTQFMRELLPTRNVVCHMNPLLEINVNDLKVKVQRWNRMVQSKQEEHSRMSGKVFARIVRKKLEEARGNR